MKLFFYTLACTFVLMACETASTDSPEKTPDFALIPHPTVLEAGSGFSKITTLTFPEEGAPYDQAFDALKNNTFKTIAIERGASSNVEIQSNENKDEIALRVGADKITVSASGKERISNAMSLLTQLAALNDGQLPLVSLKSEPRFGYRGMHLDVGRHFYPIADIKKYIDFLFFYGYNNFHWHLTEDQGWRLEIKQYPKLQEIAAYRDETLIGHYNDQPHQFDGKRYGGFYTQEEAKEIVAYAADKGITVIPEIELPGHSSAALAAYPELGCEDKEYKAATKWGIFEDIYCPKEETFKFLENVFDEVLEIFPSKYIHIGGDEAPKAAWERSAFCQDLIKREGLKDEHGLQSYFIQRMEKYLNSKGRSIIGWDEILEGGLAPNATVMSWRGEKGGIEAANQDHTVIMTPTTYCYFDYYQSDHPDEPLSIGGYLPVEKVYNYEPVPAELPADKHKYVLGAQGNVWSEYLKQFDRVEYNALVRMAALSEVLWVEAADKDLKRFKTHLSQHIEFWRSKGVNIADHLLDVKADITTDSKKGTLFNVKGIPVGAELMAKTPTETEWGKAAQLPITIDADGIYEFKAVRDGKEGRTVTIDYKKHLGNKAQVQLVHLPAGRYAGNGPTSVLNGILGSSEKYGDLEWLGFAEEDFNATLTWEEPITPKNISMRFFKGEGQWIYLPAKVEVFHSADGTNFSSIGQTTEISTDSKVAEVTVPLTLEGATQYLKIVVTNFGEIPAGKQGEGHGSWLFIDEIVIE